jgi:hypothetical protein
VTGSVIVNMVTVAVLVGLSFCSGRNSGYHWPKVIPSVQRYQLCYILLMIME